MILNLGVGVVGSSEMGEKGWVGWTGRMVMEVVGWLNTWLLMVMAMA